MYSSIFSEQINTLNKTLGNGKMSSAEKDKAKESLKKVIDDFNVTVQHTDFDTCLNTDNPMYAACLICFHKFASLKITRERLTGVEEASIVVRPEVINLRALESYHRDKQLAVNGQWPFWVAKFAKLLTGDIVRGVGANYAKFESSYAIKGAAEQVQFKTKNPVSNTNLANTLQEIVDAIVFVDNGKNLNTIKVKNCDARYVREAFTRDSSKGIGLDTKSAAQLEKIIVKMINHIITETPYNVNYREKKTK